MSKSLHQITVSPVGDRFDCPRDKPVLAAAHAANILIPYSCRSGQCGSCIGRVLSGRVKYSDGLPDAISAAQAEAGYVLFCSAYPRSDLTIELIEPDFIHQ